jgi:hypothetical protein
MLAWWQYGLWGAFGGVAVEAIELLGATQRANGVPWKKPGELGPGALAITTVIRLGLGAGLAIALAQNNEITGGLGAVGGSISAADSRTAR